MTGQQPKQQKSNWLRFFVLLGVVNIVALGASLFLNQWMLSRYNSAVSDNRQWITRSGVLSKVAAIAVATNAPGNEVFDSQQPDQEEQKFQSLLTQFAVALSEARSTFRNLENFEMGLAKAEKEMADVANNARNIFAAVRANDLATAGKHMAAYDRSSVAVGNTLVSLKDNVATLQQVQLNKQQKLADTLQYAQIALLILVIGALLATILYGRKVARIDDEFASRELKVAERLQTTLLPRTLPSGNYTVGAKMLTADEVGGDYYDIIRSDNGYWVAIGDVAGRGVNAGVIGIMVQTCFASLVHARPDALPSELLADLNHVVFHNIRDRMMLKQHVTLTILHFFDDGRVKHAGAHQDLIVRRADGNTSVIPTQGSWVGVSEDIAPVTTDDEFRLFAGDTLVLFTDGLLERTVAGKRLGTEGIQRCLDQIGNTSPQACCDALIGAAQTELEPLADDLTIVVFARTQTRNLSDSDGKQIS